MKTISLDDEEYTLIVRLLTDSVWQHVDDSLKSEKTAQKKYHLEVVEPEIKLLNKLGEAISVQSIERRLSSQNNIKIETKEC